MSKNFVSGFVSKGRATAHAGRFATAEALLQESVASSRIEELKTEVERLTIALDAVWSMLEDQGYDPAELERRMEQAANPTPTPCPNCNAAVTAGLTSCQFCGTQV